MLFLFRPHLRLGGVGNKCFFRRRGEKGDMTIDRIIRNLRASPMYVY